MRTRSGVWRLVDSHNAKLVSTKGQQGDTWRTRRGQEEDKRRTTVKKREKPEDTKVRI